MAPQWQRWLKYAKAKLDATVQDGEREMDRLEAEQAARAEGKPWLSSSGDAPTFDEARARIEDRSRGPAETTVPETTGAPPAGPESGDDREAAAFDLAARQQAAAERLAAIRDELGLGDEAGGADPTDGDDDATDEDAPHR